jgi:dTDP-4-dehydrorhamnose 3,5-epimerase
VPFEFTRLAISDVIQVQPKVFGDNRGFFVETYKYSEFNNFGITEVFVQDNHSKSSKNVLRGLHYQKQPKAQAKLVRCTQGEIIDIAVDIRVGSPTYAKWVSLLLSAENNSMMYVPAGFAHGFLVLSETAEVLYKTSDEYSPENDAGIRWDDPEIGIDWQKWLRETPLISEKDKNLPRLKDAVKFK